MKKNMKHRVLAVSSAVLCVVAMTLSVTVLPGLAYANIAKNPLFAAVLAAAAENDKSKDAGKDAGKAGKEGKEKTNAEGIGATNGEAGKGETNKEGTVGNKGTVKNPNGVSVDKNNSGNGAGKTAGNDAGAKGDIQKSVPAGDEKKQSNVPANVPERKSNKENVKQVDKNKKHIEANNKDAKEKAKEKVEEKAKKKAKKTKGQDRDADTLEKLTLDQVKKLPACVGYRGSGFLSNAIIFRPDSGSGNACAISADGLPANFDSIRGAISELNNDENSSVNFLGAKVYKARMINIFGLYSKTTRNRELLIFLFNNFIGKCL